MPSLNWVFSFVLVETANNLLNVTRKVLFAKNKWSQIISIVILKDDTANNF